MKELARSLACGLAVILLFAEPVSLARAAPVTVTGRVVLVDPAARHNQRSDDSNAVVWLTPVGGRDTAPTLPPAARPRFGMIQKNKQFQPHLLVIPVGAVVDFPNFDPFFHNVFSLFEGKRFDLGLYEAGATHAVRFDRPGVSYLFCNIHPQMSAVVVVLGTPYYAVSKRAGEVRIPNVPDGRYRLSIWHERASPAALQAASREVRVSSDASSFGEISLTESAGLIANHKNKYGREYENPDPANPVYERP